MRHYNGKNSSEELFKVLAGAPPSPLDKRQAPSLEGPDMFKAVRNIESPRDGALMQVSCP